MKYRSIIAVSLFAACVVMAGCKKNTYKVTEHTSNDGMAQVKIGYFAAYTVLPSTILYINGAAVSSVITAPYPYPGGGFNTGGGSTGDYLLVAPGSANIQGFVPVPATNNIQSKLFEFTANFDANNFYTFYVTDTGANTQGFALPDTKSSPDSGFVRLKFVNLMPNVPAIDLYKGANNTVATILATNVAYKAGTNNFDLAIPTDSFFVRPAGAAASTVPIIRRAFAASLLNRRIYTLVARGYNGSAATNLAPQLSIIVNQ